MSVNSPDPQYPNVNNALLGNLHRESLTNRQSNNGGGNATGSGGNRTGGNTTGEGYYTEEGNFAGGGESEGDREVLGSNNNNNDNISAGTVTFGTESESDGFSSKIVESSISKVLDSGGLMANNTYGSGQERHAVVNSSPIQVTTSPTMADVGRSLNLMTNAINGFNVNDFSSGLSPGAAGSNSRHLGPGGSTTTFKPLTTATFGTGEGVRTDDAVPSFRAVGNIYLWCFLLLQ